MLISAAFQKVLMRAEVTFPIRNVVALWPDFGTFVTECRPKCRPKKAPQSGSALPGVLSTIAREKRLGGLLCSVGWFPLSQKATRNSWNRRHYITLLPFSLPLSPNTSLTPLLLPPSERKPTLDKYLYPASLPPSSSSQSSKYVTHKAEQMALTK